MVSGLLYSGTSTKHCRATIKEIFTQADQRGFNARRMDILLSESHDIMTASGFMCSGVIDNIVVSGLERQSCCVAIAQARLTLCVAVASRRIAGGDTSLKLGQ